MKRKSKNNLAILFFLILLTALVPLTTMNNEPAIMKVEGEPNIPAQTYVNHDPIWVDGNADFVAQAANEGWPGTGATNNPFIISGYHIFTPSTQPFRIWNTDYSWEIRNNNATTNYAVCGTWIENTTDGVIADNIFHHLHAGMIVMDATGLLIENNLIHDTTSHGIEVVVSLDNCTIRNNVIYNIAVNGIHVREANDVLIQNNSVRDVNSHGIFIRKGANNIVEDNSISSTNMYGIKLDRNCDETIVRNNVIEKTDHGIYLLGDSNEISGNLIQNSEGTGIKLGYVSTTDAFCTNAMISDNTIINSTEFSVDVNEFCTDNTITGNDFFEAGYACHINDNGTENTFSENFYDTWIAPDADSDGYVDNPYLASGSAENQDLLPIAEPCNPIPEGYEYVPIEMPTGTTDLGEIPPIDIVLVGVIGAVGIVVVVGIIVVKKK